LVTVEKAPRPRPKLIPGLQKLEAWPWWVLLLLFTGLLLAYAVSTSEIYKDAFQFIGEGLTITIRITLISFGVAIVLGLLTSLGRVSKNPIAYNLATLYVEMIRGVPILVTLLYTAFIVTPFVVLPLINRLGGFMLQHVTSDPLVQLAGSLVQLNIKQVDMMYRAVLGLAIAYGAFEAEVFRAGIVSIERGQMEAARSLGMSYFQAMRYVILPQAIRVMLPSLGNDFIAMLKDSSLVSSLAVRDLTQMGKLYRARTFRIPAYNTVAALYLVMTLLLSQMVGFLARKMSVEGVERRGEKAAFDTRLAANFLDALFIGAASLLCLWIAERVGAALGGPLASSRAPFVLAFATIGLIYFLAFWSTSGQTPGKQIMGIKIVPAEGSSMGFGRAVLRLVTLIVSVPVGAVIGLVFPALSMVLALAVPYVSRLAFALDGAAGHFLSGRLLTLVLIAFGIRLLLAIVGAFGLSEVSGWRVVVWIVNIVLVLTLILGFFLTLILGFFLTSSLVTFITGFILFVGRLAPIAVAGLGFWWLAWDVEGQGWHDKLARTYVVKA
jgi:polar amino acid transport system permease protein